MRTFEEPTINCHDRDLETVTTSGQERRRRGVRFTTAITAVRPGVRPGIPLPVMDG